MPLKLSKIYGALDLLRPLTRVRVYYEIPLSLSSRANARGGETFENEAIRASNAENAATNDLPKARIELRIESELTNNYERACVCVYVGIRDGKAALPKGSESKERKGFLRIMREFSVTFLAAK